MNKLVLFGDSLFAQISKSELLLLEKKLDGQYDVYNCAAGGWDTNDLVKKAPYIAQLKPDLLILSVGTNDASHWKLVELDKFKENLVTILDNFKDSRIVFFLPPPNKEEWQPENKRRSNQTLKQYHNAAKEICKHNNIDYLDSWAVLMPVIEPNDTFHVRDGVHITDSGYDFLFDGLKKVIES